MKKRGKKRKNIPPLNSVPEAPCVQQGVGGCSNLFLNNSLVNSGLFLRSFHVSEMMDLAK